MASPSISVCVPTRNRAESLRLTLMAMRDQTLPYSEMIVGDDASADGTRDVVLSFQDARIRYVRHEQNIGIYGNWNSLINLCSGDYICIYHDHDWYLHTILERSANLLNEHPNMAFAHTALKLADAAGNSVGLDVRPFPEAMSGAEMRGILAQSLHSPIMAATTMVRRTAYQSAGAYEPEKYGLGCDKHMWFRLAKLGSVGYVPTPQVKIRTREKNSATAQFNWDNVFASFKMQDEEIEELYADNPSTRAPVLRRMSRERSRLLLLLSLRALLLEPPKDWATTEQRVLAMMGPGTRVIYRTAREFAPLRTLLKAIALPLHYSRIARRAADERRRVEAYEQQQSK